MPIVTTVKGLSEQEFTADVVIWPIQFADTGYDLEALYDRIDAKVLKIQAVLEGHGIAKSTISFSSPAITDKSAQQCRDRARPEFRYSALQTVTVYSQNINAVRAVSGKLSALGKQGIGCLFKEQTADTQPM